MSKQAHPSSSSSTLKRKRSTKSYEDQNEPIRNGYPNGRGIGPVIALEGSAAKHGRPVAPLRRRALHTQSQNHDQASSRTSNLVLKGGDKLESAGKVWAEVTESSFKLPAARSGQKAPELGPVQGRARAQSVAGVPSAATYRVQVGGDVPRESRSDLQTSTPISSGATVHARNRVRSASDATHLKGKTVSDERPSLQGKSQNWDPASSRTLISVRRGSVDNKRVLGDRAQAGATESTSYARAARSLSGAGAVQKGPGLAQVRTREQIFARTPGALAPVDAAARQGFRIGLRQHEMPVPVHVSSGVPLQRTASVCARPRARGRILFPLFVHLATLARFLRQIFSASYQYGVTYVAPPPIAPSNVQTTGFYYFLLVVTVQASRLRSYQEMTGNEEIYEVFFYLALATWMSSRCDRLSFKEEGDDKHIKSGSAVKNGPTGAPVVRTSEQALVHDMVKRFREHEERAVSPWIQSHIAEYITQSSKFHQNERNLLSNVLLPNLAYAAEILLSYRLTSPNGILDPFPEKLRAVEETDRSRFELLQLFPLDNP